MAALGLASTVPAAGRPAAAVIVDGGSITNLDDLVAGNEPPAVAGSRPAATIEDSAKIATLNDLYPVTKATAPIVRARARPQPPAPVRTPAEQPVAAALRAPVVTVPLGQAIIARDSPAPVVTLPVQ